MKKISLIILCAFLAGCGGSLSSSWNNFTAYYNTYYNAKKDFGAGLQQVENQPVQINPDLPVRPHPNPANAGGAEFEEAISKGALILRRHADSKWTDDALLLIGKSYYYQQEFFLAIQTMEELIDQGQTSDLIQQAIIWKGRSLLDLASFGEGISFLQNQLENSSIDWLPALEGEAAVMLAQHHAMLENWTQASSILEPAISKLNNRALRGRSFFLLGQVLQWQGDLNRAFQSYNNVPKYFPDYEYIYWANIKQAQTARLNGNNDIALSIYRSMLNDDKNSDRRYVILFEQALALAQQGEVNRAEAIYKEILETTATLPPTLRADTYYQLGQLYSNEFNNYRLAAAYFDSSNSVQAGGEIRISGQTSSLATAYEEYVQLKNQLADADSLLYLGRLSQLERDSIVSSIRNQRTEELQVAVQGDEVLLNTENTSPQNNTQANASSFGFLNYRNARMVQSGQRQFRAQWGSRPRVDNWRRTNAILSTSDEDQIAVPETAGEITGARSGYTDNELGMDVDAIPITPEAQKLKQIERVDLQYRLGSLFFFTLNQPDSAAIYFNRVLADSIESEAKPKALYSLYRLYERSEVADSAAKYRSRIISEYPQSVYADRMGDYDEEENLPVDSTSVLRQKVQALLEGQEAGPPDIKRAEQLRNLALENSTSELASFIYFEAIREYINVVRMAESMPADSSEILNGDVINPDSLNTDMADSTRAEWETVIDWLTEFKELFPGAEQTARVDIWLQMLDDPQEQVQTCRELGVSPVIRPDMESFLERVQLPAEVRNMNLSGTLLYRIVIGRQGEVMSYDLLSNPTGLGIEQAYANAIEQSLRFEPMLVDGAPVSVSCEISFPIKQ